MNITISIHTMLSLLHHYNNQINVSFPSYAIIKLQHIQTDTYEFSNISGYNWCLSQIGYQLFWKETYKHEKKSE